MLINLRQHIITLVAVFLALAVGITMGTSFIGGASVERNISRLLEKEFSKLRVENQQQGSDIDDLSEQLHRHNDFEQSIVPQLLNGRLAKQSVAIIQTGDYPEATQYAKKALETAGAQVRSVTVLYVSDDATEFRAAKAVHKISGTQDIQDVTDRMLEIIANCVTYGQNTAALDVLESEKLISKSGDYTGRVTNVVLVGGSKEQVTILSHSIDAVLIDKLKADNVSTIVGAEPAEAVTSYVRAYHEEGISTVDDIDRPLGQVALVYALLGYSGDYGIKKTAERLVPKELGLKQWLKPSRP